MRYAPFARKIDFTEDFEKYKSFGQVMDRVLNQPNDFSKKTRIYSLFFLDITVLIFIKNHLI